MRTSITRTMRQLRVPLLITVDSLAWFAAFAVATGLRLATWSFSANTDLSTTGGMIPLYGVIIAAGGAAVLHLVIGFAVRLHQGRSAIGSFDEIFLLATVMFFVGSIVTVANALAPTPPIPRTAPIIAATLALIIAAWFRGIWRVFVGQNAPARSSAASIPVLIVGAGDAGRQLVQSMQRDPQRNWLPLGFIDDAKHKRHFRFHGVSVLDTTENLERAAERVSAGTVVIALPGESAATISRIYNLAHAAGLTVKVLPGVNELMSGVDQSAVRDIEPADLLGRHQIDTDLSSIAGYLSGKRVLVTGAGGSIGSELCRQIRNFGPAELMMLDRDESALHSLAMSMFGRADLESPNVILADIRGLDRMLEVFETRRPEVVFHAAALKHVNILESQAVEAVKTNIWGTLNVLTAADAAGVERFVNISTDKAADPENVLGYSKRVAEGLTAAFASTGVGIYLSVRFGNVLGTRGSVLKTFNTQIKANGPVTVTDPEVTRYFMTINESVQLVIQAAAIGRDGEALVLDMGEPVKILDVAKHLIEQSDKAIEIVYTGLKPGEKLHEVLFGAGEEDVRPIHPLVSHVAVPPIAQEDAMALPNGRDNDKVVEAMRHMSDLMRMESSFEVGP